MNDKQNYSVGAAMLLLFFVGFAGGAVYGANQSAKSLEAKCTGQVVQLNGGTYWCKQIHAADKLEGGK